MPPKIKDKKDGARNIPQQWLLTAGEVQYVKDHMKIAPCIRCGENHSCSDCTTHKPLTMATWYGRLKPSGKKKEADKYIQKLKDDDANSKRVTDTVASAAPANALIPLPTVPSTMDDPEQQYKDPESDESTDSIEIEGPTVFLLNSEIPDMDNQRFVELQQVAQPSALTSIPGNIFSPSKEVLKDHSDKSEYPPRDTYRVTDHSVLTNYFDVAFEQTTVFYIYEVLGLPKSASRATLERFMKTIIHEVDCLKDNQSDFATDNANTIVSWKPLHPSTTTLSVPKEGFTWTPVKIDDGDTIWPLKLRFVKALDAAALGSDIDTVVNALNIVISKCFQGPIVRPRGNKFFIKRAWVPLKTSLGVGDSLAAVRGYFYTMKRSNQKWLLNINSSTSAFWRPRLVSEILNDGSMPDHNLRGVRVYINYERGKDTSNKSDINKYHSRVKMIYGFGAPCVTQTFSFQGPDETSPSPWTIQEYIQTFYHDLQFPNLAAVNCGTALDPTWYAPEDLIILPWQLYNKPVPDELTKSMLDFACRAPNINRALIEREGSSAQILPLGIPMPSRFRQSQHVPPVSLVPVMLRIPCARLGYPAITYANGRQPTKITPDTGRWSLKGKTFFRTKPKTPNKIQWKLLAGQGVELDPTVERYREKFTEQLTLCGVGRPEHIGRPILLTNNSQQIPSTLNQLMSSPTDKPDIVVLLLQSKNQADYSLFKLCADRVHAVHSICLTKQANTRKGSKELKDGFALQQYFANVAMKANLKMGMINHTVTALHDTLRKTLVLGADLTHPGPGSLAGCPSIAAVVGSVDKTGGKFLGSIDLQAKNDIIANFENMVCDRLRAWYTYRKCWPENVLYYRDGVSDTQYGDVLEQEVNRIEGALLKVVERLGTRPAEVKVTAVIVTKRHHTRFYPTSPADAMPGNENCKPGTMVDNAVTSPCHMDFYLQSHNALKGTARPAHYFVVKNDMGLTSQRLQDITHQLNHTYVRATVGVSYASPAYYADRLCERGRCYLRDWYSPDKDMHKKWDHKKKEFDQEVQARRDKKNGGPTQRKKGQRKTLKERDQEKEDKVESRLLLEAWTKKDILKNYPKPRDPQRGNNLQQTMYWM